MKRFTITTAVCLALLGGGRHHLAFCGVHRTPDERVKAEDSAASPDVASLPSNVSFPDNVKQALRAVWKRSPTFRRQCHQIDQARNLRIELSLVPQLPLNSMRAISAVTRREDGTIVVRVKIRALNNYVEIIAHEFEHILEQLEGLDLKALAAQEKSGVSRNELGAYETMRAVNAGRRVFAEYRRGGPLPGALADATPRPVEMKD